MRSITTIFFLILIVGASGSTHAQTRDTLRNDFGIELLGKGIIYSFSYQRMVQPSIGLQASLMGLGGNSGGILILPVGATLYVSPKDATPFFTLGVGYITSGNDDELFDSATYAYIGPGFEYRAANGLLFRATGYLLLGKGGLLTWPGLHVGYAF